MIMQEHVFDQAEIGVWRIDESLEYFASRVSLTQAEHDVTRDMSPKRLKEWMASRYLLKCLIGAEEPLKTAMLPGGKPFLIGRSEEISLSHSGDYVAAMTSRTDVGVDIQICKEKIIQLEHKFARPEESAQIDRKNAVMHLHLLWGAKEALYKIYAKKSLNFITHLHVDLPGVLDATGTFAGVIDTDDAQIRCNLRYHIMQNYILVYGQPMAS